MVVQCAPSGIIKRCLEQDGAFATPQNGLPNSDIIVANLGGIMTFVLNNLVAGVWTQASGETGCDDVKRSEVRAALPSYFAHPGSCGGAYFEFANAIVVVVLSLVASRQLQGKPGQLIGQHRLQVDLMIARCSLVFAAA